MTVDMESWAWKVRLALGALMALSFAGCVLTG